MLSRDPKPARPRIRATDAGPGLAAPGPQRGGWPLVPANTGSGAQPPGSARLGQAHERAEGRGAAWTEERATEERATREGGASRAPRGEWEAAARASGRFAAAPAGNGCVAGPRRRSQFRQAPLTRRRRRGDTT